MSEPPALLHAGSSQPFSIISKSRPTLRMLYFNAERDRTIAVELRVSCQLLARHRTSAERFGCGSRLRLSRGASSCPLREAAFLRHRPAASTSAPHIATVRTTALTTSNARVSSHHSTPVSERHLKQTALTRELASTNRLPSSAVANPKR